MSKDYFTYQQNWTYEAFKSKEKAERFLKENHKNPKAKVNKIKIQFED